MSDQQGGDSGKFQVEIFGNTYTLSGEGEKQYVRDLARFVDDRMVEISQSSPGLSLSRIAILAALNIADDYFQANEQNKSVSGQLDEITRRINKHLGSVD